MNTSNKFYRIILLIGCFCFLLWYLPVAYANVYACDDFWFGTNVNEYGFWGNQIHYYLNWEGSFTHTFLDSLPHVFKYERIPFLFNLFSISILVLSIYYAIREFFHPSKLDASIFAMYICAVLYTFTNGKSEIRFWVSANSYIVELAVVLFAISLYHKRDKIQNTKYVIYMTALLLIIAGSKLTFILYALVGVILQDVVLKIKPTKQTYFTIGVLLLFSLINLGAPGNFIRLQEEISAYQEQSYSFYNILQIRMVKILPFIGCSILLIPISLCLNSPIKIANSNILLCVISVIVTFVLDSVIMYICFHDPGPIRVYILCEMMILILSLFIYTSVFEFIKDKLLLKKILCLVATIMLVVYNMPMIKKIQPSIDFANESRLRNQKIEACRFDDCIEISNLPDSHLLLSYFANDIGWIEYVYAPYFKTTSKIKLESLQDSVVLPDEIK